LMASLLLAACTIGGDEDSDYGTGLLERGTPAPDFVITENTDGSDLRLSDLQGGYVLVEFWASWCPDCQRETDNIKAIHDTYGPRGLTLVGVSFDEDAEQWQDYITENGMDWLHRRETVAWKESPLSAAYNIRWIPTLYLIDPAGDVRFATVDVGEMVDSLEVIDFGIRNN